MNSLFILTLKVFRKFYAKIWDGYSLPALKREENPNKISEIIYNLLSDDKPCMIARFGANELNATINYLGVNSQSHSIWKFIKGEQPEWWWNKKIMYHMQNNAGFFPATAENMQRFGEMMIKDAKEINLLGSWQKNEFFIKDFLSPDLIKTDRDNINPFFSQNPWTRILKDKKVLIIHPFTETIKKQFEIRDKLFKNPDMLPPFNLKTLQAVQSIGGTTNGFKDWFEALEWMKNEMDKIDYEICLIGCGAYGFPLAAHAKRKGKKAIHIGGSLQLYFGIKGKRWESEGYTKGPNNYSSLFNEYWVRPSISETPNCNQNIENSCYW